MGIKGRATPSTRLNKPTVRYGSEVEREAAIARFGSAVDSGNSVDVDQQLSIAGKAQQHARHHPNATLEPNVNADEGERRMQFADAALALAGHEVTDTTLLELSRRVASGSLSADEAIAAGIAHIDAQ